MALTIDELKIQIQSDEHRQLELKKTTGELKDGMHTACAFLNTEGGWLFFGIAPTSLKILGQQVTDSTQREIAQALSYMEPQVDVRVEYIDVPDRPDNKVIAMHFEGWAWCLILIMVVLTTRWRVQRRRCHATCMKSGCAEVSQKCSHGNGNLQISRILHLWTRN